jgi:hypothetical protein
MTAARACHLAIQRQQALPDDWTEVTPRRRLTADNVRALRLCDSCPAKLECRAECDELPDDRRRNLIAGGGIYDAAGRFRHVDLAQFPDSGPPTRRRRHGPEPLPIEHGSRRGYYQHRRRNEEACDSCRQAESAKRVERNRAARSRQREVA